MPYEARSTKIEAHSTSFRQIVSELPILCTPSTDQILRLYEKLFLINLFWRLQNYDATVSNMACCHGFPFRTFYKAAAAQIAA
jgi:hypothetical protein